MDSNISRTDFKLNINCAFDIRKYTNNSKFINRALIIIHGSGGSKSTEIETLRERALEAGYHVFVTDHFILRNISKLMYDFTDTNLVTYFEIANDINLLISHLKKEYINIDLVGFSLGASASLLANSNIISRCFCFYPSLRPMTHSLLNIYTDNLSVFVGDLDSWTPTKDLYFHKQITKKEYNLFIFENTFHSFCKKNINKTIDVFPLGEIKELDNQKISDEEYRRIFMKNEFLEFYKINLKSDYKKVKLLYNKEATDKCFNNILTNF